MTILVFIETHLFKALSAISLRFIILSPLYAPSAVINNEHFESLILDASASEENPVSYTHLTLPTR